MPRLRGSLVAPWWLEREEEERRTNVGLSSGLDDKWEGSLCRDMEGWGDGQKGMWPY